MRRLMIQDTIPKSQPMLDAGILGAFVRSSRIQAGMGIHEAAAFCGVAVGTMQNIETARADVKLSTILTVCKMLGISITISSTSSRINS